MESIGGLLIFDDFDGVCAALLGRLTDHILVLFGDNVKFDCGLQLVFVIFKDFGAKVVAISVSHALAVDSYFHAVFSLSNRMRVPG